MERSTNVDQRETVNHYPPQRRRAAPGSHRNDYKALLDSTEQAQNYEFVKKTPFGEVRDIRRLRCVEWFFLVLATLTILGLLAVAIERFVHLHRQFGSFEGWNCSNSSETELVEAAAREMKIGADLEREYGDGEMTRDQEVDGFDNGTWNQSSCDKTCDSWTCTNDFIFLVLLVVNLLFGSFYCYNGLLRERQFELLGYAVAMSIIFIYVIINYCMEGVDEDYARLVRLVLMCVFAPQNIVLAVVVSNKMGYLVLNTVGSSQNLIRAYRTRSIFLTLQKFNLQLLVNVTVLAWAKGGLFIGTGEKVILFILLVYMAALSYIGWAALSWELGVVAVLWHILLMPVPGFYVYKIANVAHHWAEYKEVYAQYSFQGNPGSETHFIYIAATILTACCFGLLCCVVLSILLMITHSNFGRGLKEKLPPPCYSEQEQWN